MADTTPDYEHLCRCLYAWHLGMIDFLELVKRIEIELGIRSSDEAERVDSQLTAIEAEAE